MHTTRTSTAKRPYASARVRSFSGSPTARLAPPMSTSPELHTEIEKNASAVSRERNEPTIRPCTPRWAEELTELLVPLRGPNSAIGARTTAPSSSPSSVASRPWAKESPKRIGKLPSTTVAIVLAPPKVSRNRSSGRALRSGSGIGSTPCCSTSVTFGGVGVAEGMVIGSVDTEASWVCGSAEICVTVGAPGTPPQSFRS